MEVLILAAGYATRLHPLTQRLPKPLLPVGGQPLINHIMDRVALLEDVARIHIVANQRFTADLQAWAAQQPLASLITVYNDGTFENAERLGAIGDAEFVVRAADVADDLLVVAGDNLFDFDLRDLRAFQRAKGASVVATHHFPDRELIKFYSTVEVDAKRRVVNFIEKPPEPTTDLIGICCYLLAACDVPKLAEYLADGQNPDAPGYFMAWLHRRTPVYAFEFDGLWYDIGDMASLLEADNVLRRRAGLSARGIYEL
jgi:glucose-1-phosphate thymidylyltransferase